MTLLHHVFFWLKNPGNAHDRERLMTGLSTLRAIGGVRDMHIGVPAPTEERGVVDASYDVSELLTFDTVEDQKHYQIDPIHLAFIREYGDLWQRVVVYDTIGSSSSADGQRL